MLESGESLACPGVLPHKHNRRAPCRVMKESLRRFRRGERCVKGEREKASDDTRSRGETRERWWERWSRAYRRASRAVVCRAAGCRAAFFAPPAPCTPAGPTARWQRKAAGHGTLDAGTTWHTPTTYRSPYSYT